MRNIFHFIKYQHYIRQILNNEGILDKLSQQFGAKFETDRLGRVWTVLNPHVQNMKTSDGSSSLIYQFNQDGTMTNDLHIERWVMDQLNIANLFIRDNNLWELLTYRIKKIDNDQNYLIVIQNLYTDGMLREAKIYSIITGVLAVLGIVSLCIFL
jgi:hypothetical protein